MSRLRSRPPLFRGKKNQTMTSATRRDVNNKSLGDHSTEEGNFLLDSYTTGFKSTQQLSIDFANFKNHTFFSPARAKVDIALHKAINEYPYTGSQADIDSFLFKLTGFEKYVFDQIPKNIGFLFFSGTQTTEATGGTSIVVSPFSGNEFSSSPGATGASCLTVGQSPFEIEAYLYVPDIVNDNQVIVQRLQGSAGYTLALSQSSTTDICKIVFLVSSASDSYVVASGSIEKGQFSHIRACLEDQMDSKQASIYINSQLAASSSDTQEFGILNFDTSSFVIGSGSFHSILDYSFLPKQTLSGAIDELRFFTDQRSNEVAIANSLSQIFSTSSLGLYFRFDEPSGSYDMNSVVLDYSGHCLHSRIVNYNQALRNTGSLQIPLIYQNAAYSPVLYPDYAGFNTLVTRLLTSASNYDIENPNIVTRLVPPHYLNESAQVIGLQKFDSGIGEYPELADVPGTGVLSNTSILLRTLCMMSISLDEIKQFVDSMSNILSIELGDEDKISSQMLKYAGDYFGIDLPNFFAKSTTEQFSFGQDVNSEYLTTYTLRSLRDDLWRRILANMPYANSSKGTKNSIRSVLLSSGIVPENFFTIREYGMSGESRVSSLRDQSVEVTSMLDFSSSFEIPTGSFVSPGVRIDSPRIIGTYLSASRVEVGRPEPAGSFVNISSEFPHGISNDRNDGLLTSGSFAIEASYVFDKRLLHQSNQSLFRLLTTGSSSAKDHIIANVIYDQTGQSSGSITLAIRPSAEAAAVAPSPMLLVLTGVNLFDGERWTVGFERTRNDYIDVLSSSYILRCAQQIGGQVNFFSTSSFYSETSILGGLDVLSNRSALYNASGSYVIIGSQSFEPSTRFLNSQTGCTSSIFTGKVSHIKFMSSQVGDTSFIEHARNFASIGTINPEIGLGFDLFQSGAFERLRVDASCDQATTASDSAGNIKIFDFSQNSLHFSGSGFGSNNQIIKPYLASIDRISPRFDLQQVSNKVRVRGVNFVNETDPDFTISGPAYEIYDTSDIVDDVRFAIEHSIVKALNEDIVSTIGDSQYIDNAIGQPIDLFNDSYSGFDHLSNVYFNRLTGKIDFMRTYDVFRWVDVALSNLVETMLPKRTKFMGINYVVEPHVLERGKVKYRSEESFMLTNIDSTPEEESTALTPKFEAKPFSFGSEYEITAWVRR